MQHPFHHLKGCPMKRNKNLLVLLCLVLTVAAVAAAALIFRATDTRTADPGREVRIYLDGKLHTTAHLGKKQEISVRQNDGSVNVIALDEEGVCVSVKSACSVEGQPSRAVFAVSRDRKNAIHSWRISLSHLTTEEELERFLEIFRRCYQALAK